MKFLAKSPWVVHVNCNSCNGCDIEFLACLTPVYDAERFGFLHVGNPKHADVLVVTGSVNHRNWRVLKNTYDQMPDPKVVVALGVCSATGGIFAECYNVLGGVDQIVPVDVFVPGCPPRPEAMLEGLVKATQLLQAKRDVAGLPPTATKPTITVCAPPASPADAQKDKGATVNAG